ncbi:MAG: glycosyl hydrolase-related protein [Spirochaetaceae bacterium]
MKDTYKEIFLVPYSHLDTQWRWEYPTTIKKYLKKTLEESINLFKRYPDHQFNFTGALRYEMMRDYFPDLFKEAKKYIDQERWHLAGTCLDETDVLVPSVESMIRNILYGDRWQKDEFGKSSRDYMIPDCFGFPENMPTVMSHCGINGFSSNKLTWGSAVGIPFEIGKWRGPDGSEVVSALNPCRYDSHMDLPIFLNPGRLARLKKLGKKSGIWKSFQYYGVGDIGGSPTEGSVKRALSSIKHYAKKKGGITVKQGSAEQFFDNITDVERSKMDSYQGDFLLTQHSAGTITSAGIMKRWNRKNEQLAYIAELAAVTALYHAGLPYPKEKIKKSWSRIIASQMHDILPGTSTPTAYEFSHNDEVIALNTWTSIIEDSAKAIASNLSGSGELLLFNPHSESRIDAVEFILHTDTQYLNHKYVLIKDIDNNEYVGQLKIDDNNQTIVTFAPKLEALSWSKFSIDKYSEKPKELVTLKLESNSHIIENSFYKVVIENNGKVKSIFEKTINKELLKKPLAYEFQKERPLQFPAWNMDWKDRKKKPFKRIESGGSVKVLEHGPIKTTIEITTIVSKSKFIKEISLSAESNTVEFIERIDWHEKGCSLKLALTGNMDDSEMTYNWETSRINRGINNKKQYEVPSRNWVDMNSKKNWGISIIEDCKYGYDHPMADTIRMTLLYTPAIHYINGFWDQRTHDHGEHTIRYAIHGHSGDWKGTDVIAKSFNTPTRPFIVQDSENSSKESVIKPFKLKSEHIGILSIKRAEDLEGIIVRLYERSGSANIGTLSFNQDINEVYTVNGLEEKQEQISFSKNSLDVEIPANGIKSYFIRYESEVATKIIPQQTLKLPYNHSLFSENGVNTESILPRESISGLVESGDITFYIAENKELNALSCNSQKLNLSEGYNTLSILGGANSRSVESIVWLDENSEQIESNDLIFSSLTDFVGQWDRREWSSQPKHLPKLRSDYAWLKKCTGINPGYINRQRLEWYSNHTHKNGEDRPYEYGYLYSTKLSIPKNAKYIQLPVNKEAFIVSMTQSNEDCIIKNSYKLKDKFDF